MKPAGMPWRTYFRIGLGRRLSLLGEKLGIHWLIYNPIHFRHFHDHALANAPGVMKTLLSVFPDARRLADIGSGSGAYAAEAQRLGKQVVACEHSRAGRKFAQRKLGVDCRPFDLMQEKPAELGGSVDLAYCFEVAEHLTPELGRKLVRFLAQSAPLVVFTAAHPGQGGTAHINERPKEYWIKEFADAGMSVSQEFSRRVHDGFILEKVPAAYLIKNVLVFTQMAPAR
jgi:SAM-dependent methyltransferase